MNGPSTAPSIFPKFPVFMSEDVAVTASSLLNSQHFRDFKSDWRLNGTPSVATTTSTTTATPVVPQPNAGGQMMTMSPPAGDGAGTAGSTAPEETSASDISGDAESVWSVDIDQAFQEALAIYPPCGRRKIIISDEGKMYGRNELIARYIKLRCGKTRTRKQVSSHIQVLARKKLRDEQAKKKQEAVSLNMPQVSGVNSLNSSMNSNTLDTSAISQQPPSAQPLPQTQARVAASTTSPIAVTSTAPQIAQSLPNFPCVFPKVDPSTNSSDQLSQQFLLSSLWSLPQAVTGLPAQLPFGMDLSQLVLPKIETVEQVQRPIASSSLSLLAFSAFAQSNQTSQRTELVKIDNSLEEEGIEISLFYEKYPEILRDLFEKSPKKDMFFLAKCWANINVSNDVINTQYAVDSLYTSREKFQLKVSTMACSFGKQAVEKIEFYPPTECNGLYTFSLKNSPMCDYMVKFISELKKLENIEYMNSVLENFTVLQIVSNTETNETLMVICFVFEVSKEPEPSCAVYRLISHSPPPTIHNQTF